LDNNEVNVSKYGSTKEKILYKLKHLEKGNTGKIVIFAIEKKASGY
jgi:hypothetical protein